MSYFKYIKEPSKIITAIDTSIKFPEILEASREKYIDDINLFIKLVNNSISSESLLKEIRSVNIDSKQRMSLLKLYRRCVCPILDTEMTKKIKKVPTEMLIDNYAYSFKDINILKEQLKTMSSDTLSALAVLIGEYDSRGQSGYLLTDRFFTWFEKQFKDRFSIDGPRGAGRDIELSTICCDFDDNCPCDFVISNVSDNRLLAVGFARYDSTRGGAQSDDRTGGNSNKVDKIQRYCEKSNKKLKIIFLSDGPGLLHNDTWNETCHIDGSWDGNVRVTTLKLAEERIEANWLLS